MWESGYWLRYLPKGCAFFYRFYLRNTKKALSEHCSKNQSWPCGPEVLLNCFVSLSVEYPSPHPMGIATSFLLSLSSSETFLFHLASLYDAPFGTKDPNASAQGSSPWSSLLCSLIYSDNATGNLMRNSCLQFCILKILCTWVFTCGECYFQYILLLHPPILSFLLDVSEVTQTVASRKGKSLTVCYPCAELPGAGNGQAVSNL